MMRIVALTIVLAIAGCGGGKSSAPPPAEPKPVVGKPAEPPPAPADTETQKRGLELMLKLGELMATNVEDCGKLGTAMKQFVADNTAVIADLNAEEKKLGEAAMKAFEQRHKAELERFGQQAGPALKKCANDPAVAEAIQAFEGAEGGR